MKGLWFPPGGGTVLVSVGGASVAIPVRPAAQCPVCGHPMPGDAAVCCDCAPVVIR